MRLHGMLRPAPPELGPDPRRGEAETLVDGVACRPGDSVRLRPATATPYDRHAGRPHGDDRAHLRRATTTRCTWA